MTTIINSKTEAVIFQGTDYAFVYEQESLDKWQANEGIHIDKDTIHHTITIRAYVCMTPDPKVN
jgi:hypothetical protein